ncbi:carbohydrate kinase family protein [Candidatus Bipolaricaulota sp. J31]
MKRELVAIGDINWDTVLVVPRLPGADEEVELEGIHERPGGDAANVAVAFARLGGRAGMIGAVGTDSAGEALRNHLSAAGVDIERVLSVEGPSGRAFSLVEPGGVRRLLYTRGANARRTLTPADLAYIEGAAWVYVADPLPATVETLGAWYRENRGLPRLALDPGSAGASRGLDYFAPLFPHLSLLFLNEGEARTLSDREDPMEAVKTLREVCPSVVVKRGERGALVATRDGVLTVPALTVRAVDTTGCGDAFNAAFLFALVRGKTLEEAARWGCAAGALVAQRAGAYAPNMAELEGILPQLGEVK